MKKALSIISLLFILASCKKDVDELPPATQTGAHTFGAKVNGEFWVPQGWGLDEAIETLNGLAPLNIEHCVFAFAFPWSMDGASNRTSYIINRTSPETVFM